MPLLHESDWKTYLLTYIFTMSPCYSKFEILDHNLIENVQIWVLPAFVIQTYNGNISVF